jgi:hypothetical protein
MHPGTAVTSQMPRAASLFIFFFIQLYAYVQSLLGFRVGQHIAAENAQCKMQLPESHRGLDAQLCGQSNQYLC